ncbi:hypothetical protein WJX82_007015 [Trebouxia sp. C0006]
MSFRELRSFVEVMKALGYPRLISLDSFRLPNFELVADCLYWLFQRYDPGTSVSDDITTEADRVLFLQSIAQSMLTKARIKLNIKRLYAADAVAVKDLLNMAALLYKATCTTANYDEDDMPGVSGAVQLSDAKSARALGTEITQAGIALYDLLQQEPVLRGARNRAVARNMDSEAVEHSIQEATASVRENISLVERSLVNLEEHTRSLDSKLEKRRAELERAEKRLSSLAVVRPAYMDEYEVLQAELQQLFATYLERFRNLEFLQGQLEGHRLLQRNKMEIADRTMKHMQKRLRDDELRVLRGEVEVDEAQLEADSADLDSSGSEDNAQQPCQAAADFVSVKQRGSMQTTDKGGMGLKTPPAAVDALIFIF